MVDKLARAVAVPLSSESEIGVLWPYEKSGPVSFAVRDDVTIPFENEDGEIETLDLFPRDLEVVRVSGPAYLVVEILRMMLEKAEELLAQTEQKQGENE